MVNSMRTRWELFSPTAMMVWIPELVTERLMASIPFAGRYRMVDFILSSMVNCGIDNVSLIVRKNYHSLMDHLGSGREWDLTRKYGGLNIVPPFASNTVKVYNGRIEALASILDMLKDAREKYVVMSDANLAVNFDFTAMLEQHIESGADVTIAYKKQEIPVGMKKPFDITKDLYYTFELDDDGRIRQLRINPEDEGVQNLSMNIYIIEREFLVHMISEAYSKGMVYFDRDLLAPNLERLNVRGFEFNGYLARISDIKSYFDENMKLLKDENLDGLFGGNPIYTKIRDDNPTRYIQGSKAKNIMSADGCIIEGEVENSILFRGVRIAKGAKVKNCVLMQDTIVGEGANVEYVITDKKRNDFSRKGNQGSGQLPCICSKVSQCINGGFLWKLSGYGCRRSRRCF